MIRSTHLSTSDLIKLMDGELNSALSSIARDHISTCAECTRQLEILERGSKAYSDYREEVLPLSVLANRVWQPLSLSSAPAKSSHAFIWWGVAAAVAAALVVATFQLRGRAKPSAPELLARAISVEESPRGNLVFNTGHSRLTRLAVLRYGDSGAGFSHVQALSSRRIIAGKVR